MLQAVHLLLAFPLFVVVVAVDERWLVGSLREHYGQLSGQGATPGDYLEKIFQIPFRVQRLSHESRVRMARRLITPSLRPAGNGNGVAEPADIGPAWLPQADDPEFASLVDSLNDGEAVPQQWLEAARLTVTDEELSLIEDAAALLGATPRSVKRFVNICLLIKSMRRQSDDTRVLLLLAIATGLPDLSRQLFALIEGRQDQPCPLGQVADELAPCPERDRLTAWLTSRPHRQQTDLAVSTECLDLIRRFSFQA
ncbi:MAG: P-loop NTPase fold protein [Egibacteraceae bacterium]